MQILYYCFGGCGMCELCHEVLRKGEEIHLRSRHVLQQGCFSVCEIDQ